MDVKNKVYEQLVVQKLFGKNYFSAFTKVSKSLNLNSTVILQAFNELLKEKIIKLNKKHYTNNLQPTQGIICGKGNNLYLETSNNILIPITNKNDANIGDTVSAYALNNKQKQIAIVEKVLERKEEFIYGRVIKLNSGAIVLVCDDNKDKILLAYDEHSINSIGKKVCVKLDKISNNITQIRTGSIVKVFGFANDPIVENVVIAAKHGFVKQFNNKVESELDNILDYVTKDEIENRIDLRKLKFVTIDPSTCKDMDDAVYVERTKNGYKILTAIADVGHYVALNSEIDKEAYKRGTSCYLGDGVYPMLPEKLSNGICSLNENVDRLAIVTAIDIDKDGNLIRYSIKPAVINSKHKLSYEVADKIHLGDDNLGQKFSDIKPQIDMMFEISDILVNQRRNRGALFVNSNEADFKLDETKTIVTEIENHSNLLSTKIIESFMLLTNEAIGDFFTKNNLDTLFRVHLAPNIAQIDELNEILQQFNLPKVDFSVRSYQRICDLVKGENYEEYITIQLLKSLQKATYSPLNQGHFGLASKDYIQFTSPIRRYPDLVAHRILSSYLSNKNYLPSSERLMLMGLHLSKREQDAKDAEQESNALMNTIWAEQHIGDKFVAKIYDITHNKIIAKCGLVSFVIPMHDINKYGYKFDGKTRYLKKFPDKYLRIADQLPIVITKADRTNKEITAHCDFVQTNQNVMDAKCL